MATQEKALEELNAQLSDHMRNILKCTVASPKYGKLLLATPPETRYPYIYPRDVSCAAQLFRRLAGSRQGYDAGKKAFELLGNMARFLRDVQTEEGCWGQRYSVEGDDKSVYKQEDNMAHGVSVICNYLLTAHRLEQEIEDVESFLLPIERALTYSTEKYYQNEINLFHSTTSIHESAMEEGYTCWVNFSFLYAFSLADEVSHLMDSDGSISKVHQNFRRQFLYSVNELFMAGSRYVRRLDPEGKLDLRPDFTLLSPFYYGFLRYKTELEASATYLEKQLWDSEFDMIMRYLPFYKDFSVHIHAGNGPWLQYTAILAQYRYWHGEEQHGDQLLQAIDKYRGDDGEIPEHLSTCRRFEDFMEQEWRTGIDYAKEFHKPLLLDDVDFDKILEEANNMSRSYEATGKQCMILDPSRPEGGYIQFAMPLMWAHVEYARALLIRAKDWWKI